MKIFVYILLLLFCALNSIAQNLDGYTLDSYGEVIPFVTVQNLSKSQKIKSDINGFFSIECSAGDSIEFTHNSIDSLTIIITAIDLNRKQPINILLRETVIEYDEVEVIEKRLAEFDVGYLPPIKGVQIYTGTNTVIVLSKLNGAKSTANPRELFAKVPGLNIWESDGAGIQMGIGGRGLSPNRTANFNTRQNGYDISADALGYPESYYTPPIEALSSIEIIRGSAALQFGTQFGGLLNFIIKSPPSTTPLELTTRITGGTYGYLGAFNRIAGTNKRFFYQVYHQYKRGDGYRKNSQFFQHQAFLQVGYHITDKIKWRTEYTHMNYLAKQPGGLTDFQFEEDHRQSFRDRNWFRVDWNLLATHLDIEFSKMSFFNLRAFGMLSSRETLGFLGKITQQDPGGRREMLQGKFKNTGVETRFLHKYGGDKIHGGLLIGGRFYSGRSIANQGLATDGYDANFKYLNSDDLETSSFTYPSLNAAGFVENIIFIGKNWTLNSGLRADFIRSGAEGYYKRYVIHPVNMDTIATYTVQDSNESSRTVPLFGLGSSYRIKNDNKLYANYTQNYRAINFTDIRVNNPNVVVDSLMRDEYGFTIETGFRGLISDFFIYDIAGFYIFYGDKIGLAPKPGTVLKERTNIGDAQNIGVEVFAEFDFFKAFSDSSLNSLSWFINASYIKANYIRSKEPNYVGNAVEYVSPVIARSGLKYRRKGLSLQLQFNFNSEQFSDASNALEPSGDAVIGIVPAYAILDFSARYIFNQFWQIELGVNNLTNQKYFTRRATGYPGPGILPSDGINGYFTLQYNFIRK